MIILKKFKSRLKNERAFSLMDLLTAMAIFAILMAIAVPSYMYFTASAKVKQAEGTMDAMRTCIMGYAADQGNGFYPTAGKPFTATSGDIPGLGADVSEVLQDNNITWTGASGGLTDPWGNAYTYTPYTDGNGNVTGFLIESPGPNKSADPVGELYCSDSLSPAQVASGGTLPTTLSGSSGTAGTPESSN